jgi:hypothetical protein
MNSIEEENYKKIKEAIANNNIIYFKYSKEGKIDDYFVEPFMIGEHKTTKNMLLTAYFLPNYYQILNNKKADWKFFLLNKITDIQIQNLYALENRTNYNATPKDQIVLFSKKVK